MHYNLARFDLVSIRLAVACAQTGSLTAAARDSHLALGAAIRRIRELEAALGDALFERHVRGLLPTAAGRIFVRHGLSLLQTMDQLGAELADLRRGTAHRAPPPPVRQQRGHQPVPAAPAGALRPAASAGAY